MVVPKADSLAPVVDTLGDTATLVKSDTVGTALSDTQKLLFPVVPAKRPYDSFYSKLLNNPFFRSSGKPVYLVVSERKRVSKDEIFYLLLGLLLFLAFIKLVFSRYFNNVFRLFFQPAFRQKQTREQLLQNNLPSLLLNLFFVFSAGAYVSLLLSYYHFTTVDFWLLLLYSTSSLLVLYTRKYIFLSFSGWVFNVKEATETYIFTVYLINKIIGVVLIPFTLIIAFSEPYIINASITFSITHRHSYFCVPVYCIIQPVRRGVKVSLLHFFLYIFAFEITPLLLIYKTLIIYLDKSL